MAMSKARVITVTSVKGGTGKSTTVLNLAGIYSLMNKRVLIMDFDLYSSAICTMLNIESKKDLFSLVDDMNNNRYEHFEDYILKYNDNIDILGAPEDPRFSSKINSKFIATIIMKVELKYDVVLIDTNYFMNTLNLTTFDYSDVILYILSNDGVDLKNMRTMVSIFKDMNKDNYKIMLNSSITKGRNKYSKYDIKAFIRHDVNYYLSDNFYLKNIDSYVMNGTILTLDSKIRNNYKRVIKDYEFIANQLLIDDKKEE